jgi:hypothetical protein
VDRRERETVSDDRDHRENGRYAYLSLSQGKPWSTQKKRVFMIFWCGVGALAMSGYYAYLIVEDQGWSNETLNDVVFGIVLILIINALIVFVALRWILPQMDRMIGATPPEPEEKSWFDKESDE